jgi:pimeloyl-ACP methyl ester carboxylesterase
MHGTDLNIKTDPPLGATFMLPEGAVAAALIHQGGGVHDRDGNMQAVGFKSSLYKRVARALADRGIASLRFDKRGHDKPRYFPHTYSAGQRVEDARVALASLREQAADLPVFLVGHSEGAMVVAKLAETEDVAGVVSLAAPFDNVFSIGRYRAQRLADVGNEKGRRALEYYDRLEALFKEGGRMLPEEFIAFAKDYTDEGYAGWESCEWLAGHWADALKSDPKCPMLVVQGGRDARLPDDNPEEWRSWCEARAYAEYHLIDHMGHDLNDARQKLFRVDEGLLDAVGEWLRRAT